MSAPERARLTKDDLKTSIQAYRETMLFKDITDEVVADLGADLAWDTCRAEAKEAAAGLVALLERMAPEVPFCVDCRFFGPFDEDGCCTTCGADVILLPVAAVTADWDKFLAGN